MSDPTNSDNTFRTKFGHCRVLPDKIELMHGRLREPNAPPKRNSSVLMLMVYGAIGAYFFTMSYFRYEEDLLWRSALYALPGFLAVGIVLLSLGKTQANAIPRDQIKSVTFRPRTNGLTRSYFSVTYVNERGNELKRLIVMPNAVRTGKAEDQRALEIMKRAGLIAANEAASK